MKKKACTQSRQKHSDVKKKRERENPAGASSASRTQTISLHRLLLFAAQPEPVFNYGRDGEWLQPRRKDKRPLSFCWNGFSMFVLPPSPRPLPASWLGVRGTRSGGSMGGIKGRVFLSSGRSLKRLCYDILHVFTAFF